MSEAQEKNKALVRRFLEAQSKGEVDTVKEMLAPHFVEHDLPQEEPDHRERYLRVLAEEQAAIAYMWWCALSGRRSDAQRRRRARQRQRSALPTG